MKKGILALVMFCCGVAHAYVVSPSSIEVQFSYSAEFQTHETKSAEELILQHSEFLFGYMQSRSLALGLPINHRTPGVGAPAWPPAAKLESDMDSDGVRTIRYNLQGIMLFNKMFAARVLKAGDWEIFLPYDADDYYEKKCGEDESENTPYSFWYFYDPFHEGCENLVHPPLAHSVTVHLRALPAVDESVTAPLDKLRGDNGNGDLFQITTITGFSASKKRSDDGRVSFDELNRWLTNEGFTKTILQHFKDRPIYQFDKDFLTPEKKTVHVRITRLLAETDLDLKQVTFAKFFKEAIQTADVVLYAGHSGAGPMLEIADIESKAGRIAFNVDKQQLFFFDACSGYSYYLPMFQGRKAPGTLNVLTFGLTSQFGFEHAMHKAFLRYLFDFKQDHPTWMDMMIDMERSLRGMTFMLNMDAI